MFTGLIEAVGLLENVRERGGYRLLKIKTEMAAQGLKVGESIACDGACLTVTEYGGGAFVVEASQETVARTIVGEYHKGSRINLERALKAGDRLGGHLVSGHIDDTGKVEYLKAVGDSLELAVSFDSIYDELVIEKGSISINGVSLTVNKTKPGWLSVNLIPHTARVTTLGEMKKGTAVNLEFDMIGKYILKATNKQKHGNLTIEKLRESGW
ncbi:MAG: riboflavin synthase [Candidatus Zixiibacteriota bacterium]